MGFFEKSKESRLFRELLMCTLVQTLLSNDVAKTRVLMIKPSSKWKSVRSAWVFYLSLLLRLSFEIDGDLIVLLLIIQKVHKEGEKLLCSIASRMNKMTGKGDAGVSLPRTSVKGSQNPNSELDYTRVSEVPIIDHMDALHSEGNSWLINETNVETLFGVKFTSQSDIEVDVSNSSHLVSPSTTINVPRELNSIDVAATFKVPSSIVGDLHKLINDIEAGKHNELLSGMTNDDRMETLDALGSICNSIQANRNNAYVIPSTGASVKEQPKVNSNVRTLVVGLIFDGVNVSIPRKVVKKVSTLFEHTLYGYFIGKRMVFPVVEYYARNNWAEHGLKRIMMNSKDFFFFKFDSPAGLEAVLEGGPWLIRKSSIILKKWSMDTRLLKEELTRIPIRVDLVDVVTIGIPSLSEDGFTKETIHVEYK
ncbi:zinc knuckle CX2CX4HX4C containing protein [Tanacetum coccineum]